ncbi:esterase/lipase family protein [Thalassolituus sp. UBA3500]|uniref:esterase/lipase family protein n=1 Tax=Thalassolituus sp. UBA3500 TaxID=1947664 RepID=UPI000C0CBB1E|nr:triacylglycerol lipase [Thalassolituus sp. UBA3500]MBN59088.1 lipase [Oceanospirillaceae bacterium]|tara:strand:+ start:4797 stop:5729 length:933 start_codon:yes stop_codon:yes gene_type:complete
MKKYLLTAVVAATMSAEVSAMSETVETGYTETKYPIVLAHGLFGFDEILGVDYWNRVPETLQEDGADVYLTQVAAANSPEIRGEQLIPQIEEILAITGAEKVNLIGHSHGGPTTRYVASVRPDLVASVTSIGGVNKGTPVAEGVNGISGSPENPSLVTNLGNALATVIDFVSGGGYEQDLAASVGSMTFAEAERFNEQHPGGVPETTCGEGEYEYQGVRYYSWTGSQVLTNALDPFDYVSAAASLFFPAGEANDGLVGACSTNLGMVIRNDFKMNHFDEVNQLLGLHGLNETDPLTVFRTHAHRLKRHGL